ncbi:MAG: hypothetical protein WCH21_03645 [Bacteroidota bacterium]
MKDPLLAYLFVRYFSLESSWETYQSLQELQEVGVPINPDTNEKCTECDQHYLYAISSNLEAVPVMDKPVMNEIAESTIADANNE